MDDSRVMHVVRSLGVGGVEVGVVNIANGLDRQGFRQSVTTLEPVQTLARRLLPSIPVFACGSEPRLRGYAPIVRAAWRMRTFRPHIVHARNCATWIDATLAWLLAGSPGRLVCSIHGLDWIGRVSPRRAFIYRQLARLTYTIAAVSAPTARQFALESGIPEQRFTVLPSGVDLDRFHPGIPGEHGRYARVVLTCVARLGQLKGHEVLIRAFELALRRSAVPLDLQLVGDGPFRASLEALVRACGVESRVHFLGETVDVAEYLRRSDVFVLASLQEGRPTSIMEAMASGLPVLATRVGAVADLVEHGVHGLLVAPNDVVGLAEAMIELAHDAEKRQRLGNSARLRAAASLSLGGMVDRYRDFYRRVIAGD
jgi:glycosyltransferase involved in cell wall biosynthesis